MCAVEADAERVGTMVVYGTPLDGVVGDETVGLRTIVLVEGEDMMQA